MLPRSHRLPGHQIPLVIKSSKSDSTPLYRLIISLNNHQKAPSKFAFIISKKTAAKAVTRNQIKRRFSYAVSQKMNHLKPGYNLIFPIKPAALKADSKLIQTQITDSLKKYNLLLNEKSLA